MDGVIWGIGLALLSALGTAMAHALWKSGGDRLAVRTVIGLTGAAVTVPLALIVPLPSTAMLPWLLAASCLHIVYQTVVTKSYDLNDFAIAYPIARGIPPVATALLGIELLGDRLSATSMVGIMMISIGILAIAVGRAISCRGATLAALSGVLTTGYTLIDAKAVRLAPTALTFVAWFFILTGC